MGNGPRVWLLKTCLEFRNPEALQILSSPPPPPRDDPSFNPGGRGKATFRNLSGQRSSIFGASPMEMTLKVDFVIMTNIGMLCLNLAVVSRTVYPANS